MDFGNIQFTVTEPDGQPIVWSDEAVYSDDHNRGPPPAGKTPVHHLPTEILREIFIYVPMLEFYESAFGSEMPLWPCASQVCSRWRHITLNTPEFWTFIPLQTQHTRWIDLSITRSRPLAIYISINIEFCELEWYQNAALRVAPEAWRAREIYFDSLGEAASEHEGFFEELVERMGASPAPFLEYFKGSGGWGGHLDFNGEPPPNLRTVKIFANAFAHHSMTMMHAPLTHLELEECSDFGVLDALRRLPTLETLRLSSSCDIYPPSVPDDPVQVFLPHLRILKLYGVYQVFVGFMHYVRIPSDAKIDMKTYNSELTRTGVIPMIASLSQAFSSHIHVPFGEDIFFHNLSINSPPFRNHDMAPDSAFRLSNPTPCAGSAPPLPDWISYDISVGSSIAYQPRLIPRLLSIFGATTKAIQTLEIHGPRMGFLQEWVDVSRRLPHVSQIHVGGTASHGLVMALATSCAPETVFPDLETLTIKGVAFKDEIDERGVRPDSAGFLFFGSEPEDFLEPLPEDCVSFFEALLQVLAKRAASGRPIKRLVISNCDPTVEIVQSLRDSLGADGVECDGRLEEY